MILASTTTSQQAPAIDATSIFLILILVGFIIMTVLRQRKMKKTMEERKSQMLPGTEVMTGSGVFGTLRSIDNDTNKAVIETTPGVLMTVHTQTLMPSPETAQAGNASVDATSEGTAARDADASVEGSPTEAADRQEFGVIGGQDVPKVETAEETLRRLNQRKEQ